MKLQLTRGEGLHLFTGYGPGYIAINSVRHETSVVVSPSSVSEWKGGEVTALSAADFGFIADLNPEIIVFGTGATQRFPRPELARALAVAGVGLEVMDSQAACRTFNILAAEGRKVVAAILLDPARA